MEESFSAAAFLKGEAMERILTACQMQQADRETAADGLPAMVLMERAALSAADVLEDTGWDLDRILVVCGTGNNGGDGAAAARLLAERGYKVFVYLAGNPEKYSEQMRSQLKIAEKYPVTFVNSFEKGEYTVIIDAVFGVGLSRPVRGIFAETVEQINRSGSKVLAIDIPSGVDSDTGEILGTAVRADLTVTFAYRKPGHLLYPGAALAGTVVVKKIGIYAREAEDRETIYCLEERDLKRLPGRDPAGNKGTFRKVLVIAGCGTICGAAALSARAALRTGIGMVKVFTSERNRTAMSVLLPEALIETWEENEEEPEADRLSAMLSWADAVLIGPGLGVSAFSGNLLRSFLKRNHLPCVMDADALNLMAGDETLWNEINFPCTITPHIGEMSRLTGLSPAEIKARPLETARAFAARRGIICHLKDARSVTCTPDGICWITESGTSALATAGSGDVLAGITAGLLAQDRELPVPAAALAAYVHGLCGRQAAGKRSEASVNAGDLLDEIGEFL